uniref:Uncharacterized protein n=1 Tax=Setaria italica TaxID=4555 RepID=K3Z2X4_SETIT
MDSVLYIREEGNQKRKKTSSSFFYHLEPCEMKVSCTVLHERKKRGILFSTLTPHSSRCFSFCYFESSCFSFSHANSRYSFLFLIKRMASSSGNPSYS